MIALFRLKIPGKRPSRRKNIKGRSSMNDLSCPVALSEMQTWFARIITSPYHETDQANLPVYEAGLIKEIQNRILPSPHLKSEERLGIYHQQYWWRLLSIMQELYPSL